MSAVSPNDNKGNKNPWVVRALHSILRDKKATTGQKLKACELLAAIQGYITYPKATHEARGGSNQNSANVARIRELLQETVQ